jgi:hypothetical protein
VLKDLAMGDHDTSSVSRAKSYFLVSAIVRRNFLRPTFFYDSFHTRFAFEIYLDMLWLLMVVVYG